MRNQIRSLKLTFLIFITIQTLTYAQNDSLSDSEQNRPNFLLIWIDDLVPALNTYGVDYAISPNIDKLAAKSAVYRNAYTSVPVCGASRASVLTGLHPTPERFTSYDSRADEDAPEVKSLPELFKDKGYKTISVGKIFHNRDDHASTAWSQLPKIPKKPSHSKMLDPDSKNWIGGTRDRGPFYEISDVDDWQYLDGHTAKKSIEILDNLNGSKQPFFLAVGFVRPHLPFYAPRKYWDLYDEENIPTASFREKPEGAPQSLRASGEILTYGNRGIEYNSDKFHKIAKHGYLASISYVDALVGYVMEALERNDQTKNTIVVLMGDHGYHLGEHNFWGKHTLLHGALHTPLMISRPEQEPMDIDKPVSLVDLAPTLLDLASLKKPDHLQGHSFSKSLDGNLEDIKGSAYSHWKNGDSVIDEQWLYAEYEDGEGMLIDLKNDPKATRNAVNDKDKAETVRFLKKRLNEYRQKAKDILPK